MKQTVVVRTMCRHGHTSQHWDYVTVEDDCKTCVGTRTAIDESGFTIKCGNCVEARLCDDGGEQLELERETKTESGGKLQKARVYDRWTSGWNLRGVSS